MNAFQKKFPATAVAFRQYRRRLLLTAIANRLSWDKNGLSTEIALLVICAYIPSHLLALLTGIWSGLLMLTTLFCLALAVKSWASWYEKRESVVCGVALGGQDRCLAGVLSLFLYYYERSSNPDPVVVDWMSSMLPRFPIFPGAYEKLPQYQQMVLDEIRKLECAEW